MKSHIIGLNQTPSIKYIGYMKMLDKILELIEDASYPTKMTLIDKYIEILRIVKEGENNE